MARRTFGSIRQLPSGRYQARYRVGEVWFTGEDTFPTARAADDYLAGVQSAIARGTWVDPTRIGTVADIVEDYIQSRRGDRARPLSPDTVRTYLDSFRLIEDSTLGDMTAASVRVRDVRLWWEHTQNVHTDAQSRKAYRLLKAAFNRLLDDEEITANPCRIKGASSGVPARHRVATESELEAILEHLPERWHALVLVGAWVGPRWGELRGLQRADIDTDTGTILIDDQLDVRGVRRSTKTGEEGTVHIPPHIIPILEAHLQTWVDPSPDALVFTGLKGGPLSMSLFGKRWRDAQERAGVPRLQVHDLRRTAGTWATEKGGASLATVMRRLRHRTVAAAMGYQHPDQESDRALAQRLSASRTPAQSA